MTDNVYRVPVLAKLTGKKEVQWFNEDLFLSKDCNGQEEYFFDGVGVINGVLHSYHQKSDINHLDFRRIKPIDIKGGLTIYYRNQEISRIISDFVGSSFIYFYQKNGYELYSSCLISLKKVLKSLGIKLQKSIFFQACENIFGNGCFGYTSYEDVYILPENSMIIASKNRIKIVHKPIYEWLLNKNISYEECLEYAKQDLTLNIEAVINSNYKFKMAHITGGMDSRLVVSAIDFINKIDAFEFCCLGKPGDLDYDNAFLITGALGGKFSNRENYIVSKHPSSIEEKYEWEFKVTEGMIFNQSFHYGTTINPDLIILSGGYGELLRNFYSYEDYEELLDNPKNFPILETLYMSLYSDMTLINLEVIEEVADELILFAEEMISFGVSKQQASEIFYMLNRNRYYLGNITKIASNFTSRFDPLYSPYIFKLGYLLEEFKRDRREPLFDLMYSLSPLLTTLPFGTTKWSKDLLLSKGVNLRSFESEKLPTVLNIEKKSAPVHKNWMPAISKKNRELAKKMKASVWQVEIYPILQNKAKELTSQLDDEFFLYYDYEKANILLTKEHKNRIDIRKVVKFYSTLLWLVRGENE